MGIRITVRVNRCSTLEINKNVVSAPTGILHNTVQKNSNSVVGVVDANRCYPGGASNRMDKG